MQHSGNVIGGIFLVAGTAIGGAMLALPVLTGPGGFIPSLVFYFICWFFMTFTGLLVAEVSHWMGEGANMVTMADRTLGNWGRRLAWLLYLFFFSCLLVAYVVGFGTFVAHFFPQLPGSVAPLLILFLIAPFIALGPRLAQRLNGVLMGGLLATFCLFFILGFKHVQASQLIDRNWTLAALGLPISLAAFGYQGVIPTLTHHLGSLKKTRLAIVLGSSIPLVIYAIWQWLILGIVPVHGDGGLEEALVHGDHAVVPLRFFLKHSSVWLIGQFFAFFALSTSFIGVSLGMVDFLADGFAVGSSRRSRLLLTTLVFLPPLLIASIYPNLFLKALDFGGGFSGALLLGLLPVLMFWSGRFRLGKMASFRLPAERLLLLLAALFVLVVVGIELASHL